MQRWRERRRGGLIINTRITISLTGYTAHISKMIYMYNTEFVHGTKPIFSHELNYGRYLLCPLLKRLAFASLRAAAHN